MIKKNSACFLCLALALALLMTACATAGRPGMVEREGWPRALEIPYAENGVVVDGILDEWDSAQPIFYIDNVPPPQRSSARTWAMWDENYLYVAFSVRDHFLRGTHIGHDNAFPDDCVEILIDTRLDRSDLWLPDDYCWHINTRDAILDDRGTVSGEIDKTWNGNAFSKTTIRGTLDDDLPDEGYDVEVAIPWSDMGIAVSDGTKLGMDFCVNDFDEEPDKYLYFDWCNLEVFHKPSGFGLVHLVRRMEVEAKKPRSQRLIW